MFDLLLIDANNLCHRVHWAHRTLMYRNRAVGCLYGFFRSLISFRKKYPDAFIAVVWDHKSKRRLAESKAGVEKGVIPGYYKENRDTREKPEGYEAMKAQMLELHDEALPLVKVFQVEVEDYEADDVIYTYALKHKKRGGRVIVVSSDQDFLQLLDEDVYVFDAMKDILWSRKRFLMEFGFEPELWVDVGALKGDKSDNIFGVDGWGPVTANKYVSQYGTVDQIVEAVRAKSKKTKKEQVLLDSGERLALARSLKAMDVVPEVPKLRFVRRYLAEPVEAYFIENRFASLLKDVHRLVG